MILVIGATGTIGRPLVRRLRERGVPFRALVRDQAKGETLGCEYVVGDLAVPESLAAAFRGATRVFVNSAPGEGMLAQQKAAVDAAKQAGASYVVKLSSRGASADATMGTAKIHGVLEGYVQQSGLAWSILRPGFFMQNFLNHAENIRTQRRFFGAFRDGPIAFIDAEDIAEAAASVLEGPRPGTTHVLTGGEALTHAEAARILSAHLGAPIEYVDLPVEQIVAHMMSRGLPEAMARGLGNMMASMAEGGAAGISRSVGELTGHAPRTFDDFVKQNVASFR